MLNLLFVCMGNICRSPSAEAVMNKIIAENGLKEKIFCDSAGTIDYHEGEEADPRMKEHAKKRGIFLTSIARKIVPEDIDKFDIILAMDNENLNDIKNMFNNEKYSGKIKLITDFCSPNCIADGVPDPYYGGPEAFEHVLDLLEDACMGLLNYLRKTHSI
ncbi:MAG: low molecular weight phosphotyrosine protein phosphatase [Melioribacteraceae bacterium]|nr:low molecular weight phosphotyrosine protein phosphatase [Melioribacteraceae bacterium]MCO6473218.1 low molecular weight phosphotyrosine protein phosphatase [Melioribacteraceae bacterium]